MLLADLAPVLVVRDPARAPSIDGGRVRQAEYRDVEESTTALAGVETLLMVSAHETLRRREDHRRFVMAAAEAGVRHIVYTSMAAAAPDATFTLARDHAYTEEAIRASGMAFTFLRNNFFADVLRYFADPAGVVRGPAGDGRFAPVARADVADVAAAILRDPAPHAGATYTLTGPEALTMAEVADRLTSALGRPIRFENESVEEAYASRRAAYDAEDWQLHAWVSTYTSIAVGEMAEVTGDVERLTSHPARTLDEALTIGP
jgi:uncharacterized protein YbjT (DUF2867 family)